jgi:hypothetical protein
MPFSFMPLSSFGKNKLCFFPLCLFPFCLIPFLLIPFLPQSVSAPFRICHFSDWCKTQIMPDYFMPPCGASRYNLVALIQHCVYQIFCKRFVSMTKLRNLEVSNQLDFFQCLFERRLVLIMRLRVGAAAASEREFANFEHNRTRSSPLTQFSV